MPNLKKAILVSCAGSLLILSGITGCKMMGMGGDEGMQGRTAGRMLDDNNITEKVEEKLSNAPVYKFQGVDVKTYNGVVQLSGFVAAEDQKKHAEEIATSVEGVAKVVNNITVQQPHTMPTGRPNAASDQPQPE